MGRNGLTPRADAVRQDLLATFGKLSTGGYAPGGVQSGHMEGSAHYDGRAVDVFVRPISTANTTKGWAMAQYLVARADLLNIQTVIFSDKIWTAGGRSDSGWRDYTPPAPLRGPDHPPPPGPRPRRRPGAVAAERAAVH